MSRETMTIFILDELPREDWPSLQKYLQEHADEIARRMIKLKELHKERE